MTSLLPQNKIEAILFGSYTRGDAEPGSDIDVLILVDASRQDISSRNWQVGDLAAELLLDHGVVVSPIVENRDYFNKNVEDHKKRSAVIARFTLNYLKPEILPREYSKLISNASLIRNRSDYEDFYICSVSDTNACFPARSLSVRKWKNTWLQEFCLPFLLFHRDERS